MAILPEGSKPRLYRPRICFIVRRLNGVCCPSEIFSISDGTVIATLYYLFILTGFSLGTFCISFEIILSICKKINNRVIFYIYFSPFIYKNNCTLENLLDSIWNFYFKNEGKVNYSAITITLAIISIISTVTWYYLQSRSKLLIKHTYRAQFAEYAGGILGPTIPLFSVYITNQSRRNISIMDIAIKLNKKVNKFDTFHHINKAKPVSYPIRLDPSDQFIYDCEMLSLNEGLFRQSSKIKYFKVLVKDTLNKKYSSKKILVKDFKSRMDGLLRT